MSTTETDSRRLTLDDPISKGTLEQLRQIHDARTKIAVMMLQLEQNKINLLGSAKRLDEQQSRLFEAALVERGVAPGTPVDIDASTGKINLRQEGPVQEAVPEPPPEAPPES